MPLLQPPPVQILDEVAITESCAVPEAILARASVSTNKGKTLSNFLPWHQPHLERRNWTKWVNHDLALIINGGIHPSRRVLKLFVHLAIDTELESGRPNFLCHRTIANLFALCCFKVYRRNQAHRNLFSVLLQTITFFVIEK